MRKKLMKKNRPAACITIILLALIALLWVSEITAADPKAAGTKGPDVKAVETKAAALKTAPAYKYNPVGKADPFKPFIYQEISAKKKLEMIKPLPIFPLQRVGTDQFRLVGIAGDESSKIAIVTDVKGKFYPLYLGTTIGLNSGRVVGILADRVIVEEKIKDKEGDAKKTKTKRITMKLRKEEGEEKP
jgi:type IV pilus assembly protein PilP